MRYVKNRPTWNQVEEEDKNLVDQVLEWIGQTPTTKSWIGSNGVRIWFFYLSCLWIRWPVVAAKPLSLRSFSLGVIITAKGSSQFTRYKEKHDYFCCAGPPTYLCGCEWSVRKICKRKNYMWIEWMHSQRLFQLQSEKVLYLTGMARGSEVTVQDRSITIVCNRKSHPTPCAHAS